jgi:adhesin/invasin
MPSAHSMTSRLATVLLAASIACGDGGTEPSRLATRLSLAVQPAGARSGVPLETQPIVQLLGADGEPVAAAGVAVTAAVQGATLLGTATVNTGSDGRAVFTDVGIGGLASVHTLAFSSPRLQSVSHPMTVTAGSASLLIAATPLAQAAVVSSPVTARPAARATDAAGNPVAGITVTFAVTVGGGTVSDGSQVTGADGIATVGAWTLGPAAGANSLSATAPGLGGSPLTFTANGLTLSPTLMRINGGNGQSAALGSAVAEPPSVIVTGIGGQPVPDVPVTFSVIDGGGQLSGGTPVTDGDGIAAVGSWVLGAGANRLDASSPGIPGSPVSFTATGLQSGTLSAHNEPEARIGVVATLHTPRPAVRVTGGDGAPIPGVGIVFTVVGGGGSVAGAEQVTSADGVATVGSWRLGPDVGVNQLAASAGPGYAGSPVIFEARGVSQLPDQVAIHAGNGQSATVGTAVPVRPAVRITAAGAPVEGYPVVFSATNGTVTGASASTDANGIATVGSWTLGTVAGAQGLQAVTAIGSASFTATAVAGAPQGVAPTADGITGGVVGKEAEPFMGSPLGVIVTDQFGNRVAGAPVTFTVASGGGSVGSAPRLTTAQGIATPSAWTMGTTVGLNTLVATVAGRPPVTLRAQSRADVPASMVIAAGDGQTGGVGQDLEIDPAVRVRDQYGNAAIGSVRFEVMSGGGSGGGQSESNAGTGLASARWRLGSTPGPNSLRATLLATGTFLTFTATAVSVTSNFNLKVEYRSPVTLTQENAFAAAAARWSNIILGDVPDVHLLLAAGDCFDTQRLINEDVDDVLIFVEVVSIDGPGGVLGSAGPCVLRNGTLLPAMGLMRFDQADLSVLQASGELADVILHEMAHVLGVGTIWDLRGLLLNGGTPNPSFTGSAARQAYGGVGGDGGNVPVEGGGGLGTAGAHWRESVFQSELMTGYIGGVPNPLSVVTIGSLQDLGYVVNYGTADPFLLATALQRLAAPPRRLQETRLDSPIIVIGADGTIIMRRARP